MRSRARDNNTLATAKPSGRDNAPVFWLILPSAFGRDAERHDHDVALLALDRAGGPNEERLLLGEEPLSGPGRRSRQPGLAQFPFDGFADEIALALGQRRNADGAAPVPGPLEAFGGDRLGLFDVDLEHRAADDALA